MTRLILTTLVLLSTGPAYGEWASVGDKVEAGQTVYTIYLDPDTISRNRDGVKVSALIDFKTVQTEPGPSHLSVKSLREFDCVEERVRLLASMAFSGNMGSGQAVSSYSDSKDPGVPIEPGSVAQSLWRIACDKK